MSRMIFGSRWVPVLDERWLHSPTMLAALRRRATLEAYAERSQVEIGPEQLVLGCEHSDCQTYLVYPVSRIVEGLYR